MAMDARLYGVPEDKYKKSSKTFIGQVASAFKDRMNAELTNRGSSQLKGDSDGATQTQARNTQEPQQQYDEPASYGGSPWGYSAYGGGGGGYGGYGGYGGGGGGSAEANDEPSDMQKEVAKNLQPIVHYNYDTLPKKYELGDKVYDTADENSKNMRDWQAVLAERNASGDWYRQQQKLQSSMKNMRDEMGNAAYGSDFIDMYEDFARADDQSDDDTLQAFRKNLEEIDAEYYTAIMANLNSRNKLAADTEISARELLSDWAAQLNNIHPQLANGEYQEGVTGMGEDREEGEAPDDADEYQKLIDKEKDSLVAPDWLKTNFAEENWLAAITPVLRGMFRPDAAAQTASDKSLRAYRTNTASAATKGKGIATYLQGYSGNSGNRRTQ